MTAAGGRAGRARPLLGRLLGESPALLPVGAVTAIAQSAALVAIALVIRHMFDAEIPRTTCGRSPSAARWYSRPTHRAPRSGTSRAVALRITV